LTFVAEKQDSFPYLSVLLKGNYNETMKFKKLFIMSALGTILVYNISRKKSIGP